MTVRVGEVEVGRELVILAGPCVMEDADMLLRLADGLRRATARHRLGFVFKASFDKANRTKADSFRGPGLDTGLRWLERVKREIGVPVTTDVHLPEQAAAVAEVVDLLQVPAFLCRQTDLLQACAATGRPVNVKKGPFLAPWDLAPAVEKAGGPGRVLLTERGTTFGYNRLVADLTSIPRMQALGVPVVFDCTHAVQLPGAGEGVSGGEREYAPRLAAAAVAMGADAVFAEVHEEPERARSDAATQLPLEAMDALFGQLARVREAVSLR